MPGAIGTLRVEGPESSAILFEYFRTINGSKVQNIVTPSARFGRWMLTAEVYEELVLARLSENCFELHCHGGLVTERILEQISAELARLNETSSSVSATQIPQRESIEEQAEADLVKATTAVTAAMLLSQCRGQLRKALRSLQESIADKDLPTALSKVNELLQLAPLGSHLINPWKVQLVGPPNVGKSSLLNALLGYQRAIVHDLAGTTRDLVQAHTSIQGWPVVITDSAGIRDIEASSGEAETLGIQRSLSAAENMDLILLVIQPEEGPTSVHEQFESRFANRCVRVLNQCDRLSKGDVELLTLSLAAIPVSAKTGLGLETLFETLVSRLIMPLPSLNVALPFRNEHQQRLQRIERLLHSGQTSQAAEQLREWLE
jgi:tRNA modification GTPase